ncbi:hypothetical protein B0H63DRAFT_535229 [Podospora didyma]|uniref:Tyrosinase copper-binding domain-containing protein n=1 Tax=Podospora didyma TaxID=330526 RepID=A0AAE0K2F4_9PEZI|nr:hypothetical protein B0H63DRAFT_535229 [Podospora didyma]
MALHVIVLFALGIIHQVQGLYLSHRDGEGCRVKSLRKPWQDLTDLQRASYINSTLCLMDSPGQQTIPGAKTLWDELHYAHIAQATYIHFVGSFLPWHRYFLVVHETLLRRECGYNGPMPYWNEVADVDDLNNALVLDVKTGFGGNGEGPNHCVADGPFVNLRFQFKEDLTIAESPSCLVRNISDCSFTGASRTNLDACLAARTYDEVWHCLEAKPHIAGHWGIGGTMSNTRLSPGDPLFFLHHAWLDRLWWLWQSQDLPTRLKEIGGANIPVDDSDSPAGNGASSASGNETSSPSCSAPMGGAGGASRGHGGGGTSKPNKGLIDYFNDGGNTTTLDHTLWSARILPNVTIADVMDLHGAFVCAEYV